MRPSLVRLAVGFTSTVLVAPGLPALLAAPAHAEVPAREFVLSRGHLDAFEVSWSQATGQLELRVKDATQLYTDATVFRDPATVTIDADAQFAALQIPEDLPPDYAFLGAPGETVHLLPETQADDLPWPGWSTERLQASLPSDIQLSGEQPVQLAVTVDGPGEVHTWMSGPGGEVINHYVDSSDQVADVIPVRANAHVHTNWSFSAIGDYLITVTPSAQTTTGVLTGPAQPYHVHVGDPLAPFTPVATEPPIITGTPEPGMELYSTQGAWNPTPTEYVAQRWLRNGSPIEGATGTSYMVTEADRGADLTSEVTVRIGRATATAVSAARRVLHVAPEATTMPAVRGTVRTGSTVTSTTGTWDTAGLAFSRQWLRDGVPISGATAASYTLTRADHGHRVAVRVRASKAGHATGTATAVASTVAVGPRITTLKAPRLTGTTRVRERLRVTPGLFSPGATSRTYRWTVGGRTVGSGRSLLLRKAYAGRRVTATVTVRSAGYRGRTFTRTSTVVRR